MSQLRYYITTHDWVIFAPERSKRTHDMILRSDETGDISTCPFCPGHESETHGELLRIPDPADPRAWSVKGGCIPRSEIRLIT